MWRPAVRNSVRLSPIFVAALLSAAVIPATQNNPLSFQRDVQPILSQTCQTCHNDKIASGGLIITQLLDPSSLTTQREQWEKILAKVQSGEMPPKTVARPDAMTMDAFVRYVQNVFDRADRSAKPNPGRVVAHRLN